MDSDVPAHRHNKTKLPPTQNAASTVNSMRHHSGRGVFLQKLSSLWAQDICSTSALCWGNKPVGREASGQCSRSKKGWLKQLPPIHGKLHLQIKQFVSEALPPLHMVILWRGFNAPLGAQGPSCCFLAPRLPFGLLSDPASGPHPIRIHGTFTQTSTPGAGGAASARSLPAAGMLPASGRSHASFLRNKQRWQPGQWFRVGGVQSCGPGNTSLQSCHQRLLVNCCTWFGIRVSLSAICR